MDSIKTAVALPRRTLPRIPGYVVGVVVTGVAIGLTLTFAEIDLGRYLASLSVEPHWPDISPILRASPVVQVHIYTALVAVGLGAVMMLSRKGARFHRVA